MSKQISVTSYILLRHNRILLNGELIFENREATAVDFLHLAYEHFQINYPKFFKMDNLCKTGFIAAELLLRGKQLSEKYKPEEIGLVISNANSSLDTDIRYAESMAGTPSPGLFVYTLPNVLIGELCIRNQIKGESACFVFDIFDPAFQTEYVNGLFETGKVKGAVSGWADYYGDKAEAFFYIAEINAQSSLLKHKSTTIHKIFEDHE